MKNTEPQKYAELSVVFELQLFWDTKNNEGTTGWLKIFIFEIPWLFPDQSLIFLTINIQSQEF